MADEGLGTSFVGGDGMPPLDYAAWLQRMYAGQTGPGVPPPPQPATTQAPASGPPQPWQGQSPRIKPAPANAAAAFGDTLANLTLQQQAPPQNRVYDAVTGAAQWLADNVGPAIPPELRAKARGAVEAANMVNPAPALRDYTAAAKKGNYGEAALNAAGLIPGEAIGAGLAKLAAGGKALPAIFLGVGAKGIDRKALAQAKQMEKAGEKYAPLGGDVNVGVDAPTNKRIQTVREPYRMMYPGIYGNPREIASEAASRVAPENPAMKQLWGVSRGDLDEIAKGRVGTETPRGVIPSINPRGSVSAQNVMTPRNEQRLIDILGEGGKHPGLKHADAWYIMDPVYQRLEQMFGPAEAVPRYRQLNTMMGMASPGSDVLTEIQRGSAAHWLNKEGRFGDFKKYAGMAEGSRGPSFPADMRYIGGHPYHKTSQAGPMEQFLERGELRSEAPKVPLYVHASGTPQTGFQTTAPVGDAHFSRGVGMADTRKGPTDVGASFSRPEYETLAPWWREKVAQQSGVEAVPAQARLWTVLGPQTGVDSPLGQGKLELFSQQIMKAAQRLGISPEKARDLVLSGGAGAGVLAALAPGLGNIAAEMTTQQEQPSWR